MNFDEGPTVAYTGPRLAELLASPSMCEALDIEIDVEQTVVIPGSPARSIAPVAYTLSGVVAVGTRRERRGARLASKLSVAAVGLLVGSAIGLSLLAEPLAAARAGARQARKRECGEEKASLVVLTSPTAASKRQRRLNASVLPTGAVHSLAPAPPAALAPPHGDEAASDERLIRAALSERSL